MPIFRQTLLFLLYTFLLQVKPVHGQDHGTLDLSNPSRTVYDTFRSPAETKEKIMRLEAFRDSLYARPIQLVPDTTVRYQLRFYGSCSTSWSQLGHHEYDPQDYPVNCRCSLGTNAVVHANDLTLPGTYTLKHLQNLGQVWVMGNRYTILRTPMVVHPGNMTDFGFFGEYYFERVE